jgi:hypothetical protein
MKPCRARSKGGRLSHFSIKPIHSKFSNISTFVNAEKKIYNLKTQVTAKNGVLTYCEISARHGKKNPKHQHHHSNSPAIFGYDYHQNITQCFGHCYNNSKN